MTPLRARSRAHGPRPHRASLVAALLASALLLAAPVAVRAQPGGGGPGFMRPPAFMDDVFRPELIMRYQRDIALTADQQQAIRKAMSEAREKLDDLQWQFEAKSQDLSKLVEAPEVDEAQALAELDRMLAIEEQMKRAHFLLLVRIKNQLTPEQQTKLREMRKKEPGPGMRPGPPPPP